MNSISINFDKELLTNGHNNVIFRQNLIIN